jgi:hypothetical protein
MGNEQGAQVRSRLGESLLPEATKKIEKCNALTDHSVSFKPRTSCIVELIWEPAKSINRQVWPRLGHILQIH